MKKFVKQLFLFFFLFGAMVFGVTRFDNVGRVYNANPNVKKLTCQWAFDSLDILFVGNSYCYAGINAPILDSAGLRTYNLGIASAGVNYYVTVVHDYLATIKHKPKAVFMAISPFAFCGKSDDAMNNPIYRFLDHPISNEEYILKYEPRLAIKYPEMAARSFSRTIIGLYSMVAYRNRNSGDTANNEMFASKGFIPSDKVNTPENERNTDHFYASMKNDVFDTVKGNRLLELAAELEQQHIKVVYFELPSNKLYSFFNADYLEGYRKFIEQLSARYTYIKVDLTLGQDCYRDQDHLNITGSRFATHALIGLMRKDPELETLFPQ